MASASNSTLLTMPIMNGVTTLGTDNKENNPMPANLFGNIVIGAKMDFQDVPVQFGIFSENYISNSSTVICGGHASGWRLGILDFTNIFVPDIKSETYINLDGSYLSQMPRSWAFSIGKVSKKLGNGKYHLFLPIIPPAYGEYPFSPTKWNQYFKTAFPGVFWHITYIEYSLFKTLAPACLYSRFYTSNIRKFIAFYTAEYPAHEGDAYRKFYGYAENMDMVPTMWGAQIQSFLLNAVGIYNIDALFACVFKYLNIKNVNALRSWYFNTLKKIYTTLQQNAIGISAYVYQYENRIYQLLDKFKNFAIYYHPLNVLKAAVIPNLVGGHIGGCSVNDNEFFNLNRLLQGKAICELYMFLWYLFESDDCKSNIRNFYIDIEALFRSFNSQGVYCRNI